MAYKKNQVDDRKWIVYTSDDDHNINDLLFPDYSITSDKLAPNSVTTSKIEDGAVTTNKMPNGAVTADKIASLPIMDENTVGGAELGSGLEVISDVLSINLVNNETGTAITAYDASYLESLTIEGKSIQDGTPTPETPVDVQVVALNWNQLFQTVETSTIDGITTSYDSTTHLISITNNSRTTNYSSGSSRGVLTSNEAVIGHKYYIGGDYVLGVGIATSLSNANFTPIGGIYEAAVTNRIVLRVTNQYDFVTAHPVGSTTTLHMFVVDLTEMFGAGNEPTAEQFEAMYPESYYPYNAGSTQILLKTGTSYTPIDLQDNVLASLPDDTKDMLMVDSVGHVVLEKRVAHIANYNGESVGSVFLSTTGELTTGAEVYYKASSTSTVECGYIDIPSIANGATISITAKVTPTIMVSWWARGAAAIASAIKELRDDLLARIEAIEEAIADL